MTTAMTTMTTTMTMTTVIPRPSRLGRTKLRTSYAHVVLRAATGIYVLLEGLEAPLQRPYVGARHGWPLHVK